MWVEVHTESGFGEAQVANIMPDKVTEWEVRVVVWETNKVPKSQGRRTADIYVVGEMTYFTEDSKKAPVVLHETDYHEGKTTYYFTPINNHIQPNNTYERPIKHL